MRDYFEKFKERFLVLAENESFVDLLKSITHFSGAVAVINLIVFKLYPIVISFQKVGSFKIKDSIISLSADGSGPMYILISRARWLDFLTLFLFVLAFTGHFLIGYIERNKSNHF